MEISVFLSHQRIEPEANYTTELYAEKLVEAKLADRLNFDCIWVPEHHMIQFMQAPNGLILASFYGAHVACSVGQMVNLLLYRHPLVSAGEIALADRLLNGRLQLGVGRGAYNYEFQRLGISWDIAEAKFQECIDVLETIWANPERGISYDGQFFNFETTSVWPRLASRPHPPVWYAAMTPPSIEFAAQRGYNVATWPFLRPMSFVEDVAAKFHRARERAGGKKGQQKLAVMRPVFVGATNDEARKATPKMLDNHRLSQLIRDADASLDDRGFIAPAPLEKEPTLEQTFDVMLAGDAQLCLEKLELYERLGVDHFIAWFDFGLEHTQNVETMQRFAEEVMVPFRRSRMKAAQPLDSIIA